MPTEREAIRKFLNKDSRVAAWVKRGVAEGRIGCSDDLDKDEAMTVVAGHDSGGVIGSIQSKCGGCGSLVWLSPSTQEMMAKRGDGTTLIRCLDCVLKEAKEMGK